MEFDETNGSQEEGFTCDDVGDEPLRDVMKKMAIGQVKPKKEDEELPIPSIQVEASSKDDSMVEEPTLTHSHIHYESSDEEDGASHPPQIAQGGQDDEDQLPFRDTHITFEQAQAQTEDVDAPQASSPLPQERETRTTQNHPIELAMGDPSGGVRTRRRQYAFFVNISHLFLAWNPHM
jgi:hypothetical protein